MCRYICYGTELRAIKIIFMSPYRRKQHAYDRRPVIPVLHLHLRENKLVNAIFFFCKLTFKIFVIE